MPTLNWWFHVLFLNFFFVQFLSSRYFRSISFWLKFETNYWIYSKSLMCSKVDVFIKSIWSNVWYTLDCPVNLYYRSRSVLCLVELLLTSYVQKILTCIEIDNLASFIPQTLIIPPKILLITGQHNFSPICSIIYFMAR